jgi:tetratricopeptide (TPR) repeat protein
MKGIGEWVHHVFHHSDVPIILGFLVALMALLGVIYAAVLWKERQRLADQKYASVTHKQPTPRDPTIEGIETLEDGRFEEARTILLRAVAQDPKNAEILIGLALSHYELGELNQAEKYYTEALEINPEAARAFRGHLTFQV